MNETEDQILETLWSLWAALGVPGLYRGHEGVAIDLEPLILFTPLLTASDPRLMHLAFGWCAQHGQLVSVSRLRGLFRRAPESVHRTFAPWAASLSAHGLKWPGAEEVDPDPLLAPSHATDRRMPLDWARPAMVRLRARKLFGPGTKADLLCEFLSRPQQALSASELTWTGYSKRSLSLALSDFTDAGIVSLSTRKNVNFYRLNGPAPILKMLQASDVTWLDTTLLVHLLTVALELAAAREQPGIVQRVVAARLRDHVASWTPPAWLEIPNLDGHPDAPERLARWLNERLLDLAPSDG